MKKFPKWLHKDLLKNSFFNIKNSLKEFNLNTVCEEAKCPNRYHCFQKKRATFLALGKVCTRKCKFCNIKYSKTPLPVNKKESKQIALFAKALKLKAIVITMVTRDDLEDQGSFHIANTIKITRSLNPKSSIEVLTSDFSGNKNLLDIIISQTPDIFSHNLETVLPLTKKIRSKASYERSLEVLKYVKGKNPKIITKSSIMVGLGETISQLKETIYDLKKINCSIITIGQYLQPSKENIEVKRFLHPKEFKRLEDFGHSIGIKKMICSPFVRSSYIDS